MKRLSMLVVMAAVTYALTGCIITDYPCIEDTENQDYNAACSPHGDPQLHDTEGWAHFFEEEGQSATDNDGDGVITQWIPFVMQDTSGVQMIASVVTRSAVPEDEYQHHDDTYMQGATLESIEDSIYAYAIYTPTTATEELPGRPGDTGAISGSCVQDPVYDPVPFDYQLTTNCMEADGDLSVIVDYVNRTHEAGRAFGDDALGIPLAAKLAILQASEITEDGMMLTWSEEISLTLSQAGYTVELDTSGLNGRKFLYDPTDLKFVGNALWKQAGLDGADFVKVFGPLNNFVRKEAITLKVDAFGQTFTVPFALTEVWDSELTAAALDSSSGGGLGRRR